jgi:hypothetical protein
MVEWTGITHISDNVLISTAKALFYPLSPFALIVVVMLYSIGMLFSENFYINECLFFIFWTVIGSYSLTVLKHTIQGKESTPPFTAVPVHEISPHILSVFKQATFFIVSAALFYGSIYVNNKTLAYMVLFLSVLILPLGIMRSFTTGMFRSFFDLEPFSKIMKKAGFQYMIIMVLCIPVVEVFYLMTVIHPALAVFLVSYLMISIYRLLGQMVLKCHNELNYSLNYENFKSRYSLEAMHGFKA